ncbi:SRPBCC family protein [Stigmatella sp. ncwal1]|uniref:SRPBCC family protein n=1 Tax=Stigmatella ashevillensis TaxID=2995309 RepID=A0ABT5D663_9BACT|nr:SRPBCC family protein [Stigmatella ashevillena]MDC0708564.1 SRPBCC family protein [Stigmatella ashevillena]
MLKPILLSVAGAVALGVLVVLVLASRKPESFHIERRTVIAAPPEAVFPHLNDFRRWARWSPWEKLDPSMQKTYGGPPSGVGSTYAWRGDSKAGEGTMTILESRPSELLTLRLEFLKPFPATNTVTYTLVPKAGGTEITWAMDGKNTFMGKIFAVFFDMDALIGKDFERGLADLKQVSEEAGP